MMYAIRSPPQLSVAEADLASGVHDALILLHASDVASLASQHGLADVLPNIQALAHMDATLATGCSLLASQHRPVVLSPVGRLDRDYDDVRRYGEAAAKAVQRLQAAGSYKRPLVLVEPPAGLPGSNVYARFLEVAMLAALAELDEAIEVREALGSTCSVASLQFAVLGADAKAYETEAYAGVVKNVLAIEAGRRLARDIGGSDPERTAPLRCAAMVEDYFATSPNVSVEVVRDHAELQSAYPLFMAVARSSLKVERHHPCVVKLAYQSPDQSQVTEELFLVGKGVTFDTGGADLKVGGHMVGMSRDKCGAAAMAGLMATVSALAPTGVNVTVELAFVRNSIGSDAYVCDEIIRSRAGVRVRIGNTDAEGRMAMGDLLAEVREKALRLPDPSKARLFTCATLTGHVVRAYGPYAAAMDNGPARAKRIGKRIRAAGELLGDPFELSTIRREDYAFVAPTSPREDVLQANSAPSTMTNRGHQYPFAFLAIVSGLDKHGNDSTKPLAYTHLDVAGAAESGGIGGLGRPTGCPIVALSAAFIGNLG